MGPVADADWLFLRDECLSGFRAAGVLMCSGRVLAQRELGGGVFALPGGHVAWGETSAETVAREFAEELEAEVEDQRLLWVEESFWHWGRRDTHQICHYHLVTVRARGRIPPLGSTALAAPGEASPLVFEWVDVATLAPGAIQPPFLRDRLGHLPQGIEHLVTRE